MSGQRKPIDKPFLREVRIKRVKVVLTGRKSKASNLGAIQKCSKSKRRQEILRHSERAIEKKRLRQETVTVGLCATVKSVT